MSTPDVDAFDFDAGRIAQDLGRSESEVDTAGARIANLVRDWISEPLPSRRERTMDELRGIALALVSPRTGLGPEEQGALFGFLVTVTAVIMQFLTLVPAQQAMVAEGIHREPLFRQGISEDLARVVPEALIGRLSGIRFRYEDGMSHPTVRLQYVSFRGAPRGLLYRLHELLRHEGRERGSAVLLASATSFLLESPTYHVPVGPDLVLHVGEDVGWRESRYARSSLPLWPLTRASGNAGAGCYGRARARQRRWPTTG